MKDIITPSEFARRNNIALETVKKMCEDGKLPCIKTENRYYIKISNLNNEHSLLKLERRVDILFDVIFAVLKPFRGLLGKDIEVLEAKYKNTAN